METGENRHHYTMKRINIHTGKRAKRLRSVTSLYCLTMIVVVAVGFAVVLYIIVEYNPEKSSVSISRTSIDRKITKIMSVLPATQVSEKELSEVGTDMPDEVQEQSQQTSKSHTKPKTIHYNIKSLASMKDDKRKNELKKKNKTSNKNPKKKSNKKKKKRKRDPPLYDFEPEWGVKGVWDMKYIELMETPKKILLKKNRRVVFPNVSIELPRRTTSEPPSNEPGKPRELLKANRILQQHPLFNEHKMRYGGTLEDVMYHLKHTSQCSELPIFLSMAQAKDELYWQLIENFVYTSVKFKTSDCALVICVSDSSCMKMCEDSFFPCFNYESSRRPLPHVMEQIAEVKLLHVPKALDRGVDVFMLDLDVGFLGDPHYMVEAFRESPIVDVLVQEDQIFIMNRTKAGWKSWFTEPLPNIGMFLARGNNRTAKVFEIAWNKYLTMNDPYEKSQPGKDQNHVLDGMRIGRGCFGLKYAYFGNETAPLLDKLVLNYGTSMELGGELMEQFLHKKQSIGMHTTCYEKSTKVMGLKAANSFWNPKYYDPLRRTLTKPLIFQDERRLLDEVRSLAWLAMATERSVIIPNLLGPERLKHVAQYKGQAMWPGFRIAFLKRQKGKNVLRISILEPGYYWRVNRDYDDIPEPSIVYFTPGKDDLKSLRENILKEENSPRVIIQQSLTGLTEEEVKIREQQLLIWANDSVGLFSEPYDTLRRTYRKLPSLKDLKGSSGLPAISDFLQGMRNCARIFYPATGNRTCFQVCD